MDQSSQVNASVPEGLAVDAASVNPLSSGKGPRRVVRVDGLEGSDTLEVRVKPIIERLYPKLDEAQRNIAAENLLRYCEIALAVTAKESREPVNLTGQHPIPTMKERSNVYLKE